MSQNGKGDKRRPRSKSVTKEQFDNNWDSVFDKQQEKQKDKKHNCCGKCKINDKHECCNDCSTK